MSDSKRNQAPLKLLIDTDPGVDDAMAMLLAAAHPRAHIDALLTVGGNVGIEATTMNACRVLDLIGSGAPVYRGCASPLVHPSEDAAYVHGRDGLGDVGFPASTRAVETLHASVALIERTRAAPGALTLVCLGPLTNLALALKLDPELPSRIARLIVMGGAVTGRGNTPNVGAEFNFFADPEAAFVICRDWPALTLVDWELVVRNAIPAKRVALLRAIDTERGRFFRAISEKVIDFVRSARGEDALASADPLAMAVALEPQIVTARESHAVEIQLGAGFGRGQSLVDWNDVSGRPRNVEIVTAVDTARFHALLEAGLRA
jgi:purine nucleosidase